MKVTKILLSMLMVLSLMLFFYNCGSDDTPSDATTDGGNGAGDKDAGPQTDTPKSDNGGTGEADAGSDITPVACTTPADKCLITTPAKGIRKGESIQLHGEAFSDACGVDAAATFEWASSDTNAVTVDASGKAVGGSNSGVAEISAKAKVKGQNITCSNTVKVTNYGDVTSGIRVVVYSELGGAVKDAKVLVNDGAVVTTDNLGVAQISGVSGTSNISIFHNDYDYVTIMQIDLQDIVIYLSPKSDNTKSAGFRGNFKFNQTKDCYTKLGLSGVSLPGNMLNFNFSALVGDSLTQTLFGQTLDIPSALVLSIESLGIDINEYKVIGSPGRRIGWGIGGCLNEEQTIDLVSQVTGGSSADLGEILPKIIPLFSTLKHAVKTNLNLNSFPRVPSQDQNGKAIMISDFAKFDKVDLDLTHQLTNKVKATIPNLPLKPGVTNQWMDSTFVLVGTDVPNIGLVPTGLTIGVDTTDAKTNPADGKINPPEGKTGSFVELSYADLHHGLEGNPYKAIALSTDAASLISSEGSGSLVSGLIEHFPSKPGDFTFKNFAQISNGISFTATAKKITIPAKGNTDIMRAKFMTKNSGNWTIFYPGTLTGDMVLPNFSKASATDRTAEELFIQGMTLNGVTYKDLFKFNSNNTDSVNSKMTHFTVLECKKDANAYCLIK